MFTDKRKRKRIKLPDAIASAVRIALPVDFSDFNPPGRIIVQSYSRTDRYTERQERKRYMERNTRIRCLVA